ncbi:MAG: transglycosylase domain-containing protein [Actinomycetota bacterium]|nr:transglycosylase domain-containing protein [Actinomycetota bacterium]
MGENIVDQRREPRLRLRHIVAAVAALLILLLALGAVAWFTAPVPVALRSRVSGIERAHHAVPVPLGGIPVVMREAVVATEDERFYRHHGIDTPGIVRAAAYDLTHLSTAQGASTITEQLAKIVYLGGNDHSLWGKLQDATIALRIEGTTSKQQILDDYLNLVYFGHHAYGISRAAHTYFGETASKLSLAQASLLAGLIQAPSAYDPLSDAPAARARQVEVLRSMVRNGYAASSEAREVLSHRLPLSVGSVPPDGEASLSPGPLLAPLQLVTGVALMSLAVIGWTLSPRWSHGSLMRLACVLAGAVGMVELVGSLRFA